MRRRIYGSFSLMNSWALEGESRLFFFRALRARKLVLREKVTLEKNTYEYNIKRKALV